MCRQRVSLRFSHVRGQPNARQGSSTASGSGRDLAACETDGPNGGPTSQSPSIEISPPPAAVVVGTADFVGAVVENAMGMVVPPW